jgi:hypothetical protein
MNRRIMRAALALMLCLTTTACGIIAGGAIGAGAGAAIGSGTHYGAKKGALVGGGAGAATGAVYDLLHGGY